MTTFTADLPDTKSETGAGIEFLRAEGVQTPKAGLLRIVQRRCTCTYAVVERYSSWRGGRAFELKKVDGDAGSDATEERYWVFVAEKPDNSVCGCRGWNRHGHCKHLAALTILVESGQL